MDLDTGDSRTGPHRHDWSKPSTGSHHILIFLAISAKLDQAQCQKPSQSDLPGHGRIQANAWLCTKLDDGHPENVGEASCKAEMSLGEERRPPSSNLV
jgi:hypothetical protein